MPIVQVEILPRSQELKRALAKEVTKTIVNVLNCPPDAVRVIIREMPPENYAMAGVLAIDKK
ncbi:MAG: tautomerase family protein [Clostridia bacterium]|jgi:4-oxalocrotonate tautomerase|nr:tautomerase family protein [Clostridia bacterium]MDD4571089.1 tautomerase family protein [Clostridia bacterium]